MYKLVDHVKLVMLTQRATVVTKKRNITETISMLVL